MDSQRKLLGTGLGDEPAFGFIIQLPSKHQILYYSSRFISNRQTAIESSPQAGYSSISTNIVPRSALQTSESYETSVTLVKGPGVREGVTHSPNVPRACSWCKNMLNGITLFPILTTEGLVLCQSICATYPVEQSPLVFELDEDDGVWILLGLRTVVCPPMNLGSV